MNFLEFLLATFSGAVAAIVVSWAITRLLDIDPDGPKGPSVACMVRFVKMDPDSGHTGDYYRGWRCACMRILYHLEARGEAITHPEEWKTFYEEAIRKEKES
jgi:hypothetical protein